MNKQVFTLMAVFLMLGGLFSSARGQGTTMTITDLSQSKVGSSLADDQYYLIGTGSSGNFLAGKKIPIGNTYYTILDASISSSNLTNENIDRALWKITNITVDNAIIGCYLTNKATGGKLSFTTGGEVPDASSTSFTTQFLWFPSNRYQGHDKAMKIQLLSIVNKGISATNGISDYDSADEFNVYTTEQVGMTAQELNQRMGNGFILAAKGQSNIEETPLLSHKLVAVTFKMKSDHSISTTDNADAFVQAKRLTGFDETDNNTSSRTYFVSAGYEYLSYYNITASNYSITIDDGNVDKVLKAFKAMTFVAASNSVVLDLTTIFTEAGYGRVFTTKKGSELLQSGVSVTYLNAQFEVEYSQSQGGAATVNDLNIQLPYAKFGSANVSVRPYVIAIADEKYLITVPNTTTDKNTRFGFASYGGTVDYDQLKNKAYSISVADKEVKLNGTLISYKDFNMINATIHPLSYHEYKQEEDPNSTTDLKETIDVYYGHVRFGDPSEFLADKPEGQWIVTEDTKHNCLLLNNRESAQSFLFGNAGEGCIIYKVDDADDLYYIPGGIQGTFNDQSVSVDTIRLTPQTLSGLDGYAHSKKSGDAFDQVVLKSTAYKLGIQNGTFDNSIVYVQNSSTHKNTLVVDVKVDEGLSFYLVPCDTVPYGITRVESMADGSGYYDTNKKLPIDNLKRIKYALQERTTKRYVRYDSENRRFMLSDDYDDVDKALQDASKFFFKEKEDGQYILLHCEETPLIVDDEEVVIDGEKVWVDNTRNKVYANIGDAFLHEINLYTKDIADKFGFYSSASPMFADIMRSHIGKNDTTLIKINLYSIQNRSGKNQYMLVPGENNFLMEGIPDTRSDLEITTKAVGGLTYDSLKFSIAIDTAYVRRTYMTDTDGKRYLSSVMPLYYLGMSSKDQKENVARHDTIGPLHPWDRDEFGHLIECQHYMLNDTVSGNFLFAMTDSIYHGVDKIVQREDHCYHYWNAHNPRLRFVHAAHVGDTMIVSATRPAVKDTMRAGEITTHIEASKEKEWLAPQIEGGAGSPNYGLFAFELNPNPNDPEVPEYALWNPASKKYVAYLNGNLIIADQPSYYTIDVKSKNHSIVSNETVQTSDIRVVTSKNKVIILNAEGKKAFIHMASGRKIAEKLLTSDQEEFVVPEGVMLITLENEATFKAIVK